jgi:preprotein translocase subunit SecG
MYAISIGLLTVVMILDCLVLVFLVLIQLPKKEAGAGLAFGAGATDALFGAGSGTVLTKITKHAATIFFVLAIVLSVMQMRYHRRSASRLERELAKPGSLTAPAVAPAPAPVPAVTPGTNVGTNTAFPLIVPEATNVPAAAPASNAPAATNAAPGTP